MQRDYALIFLKARGSVDNMDERERWFKAFETVSELFRDAGIRHSFIKMLHDPFEWGDVDVLIRDPLEIRGASRLLKSEGFTEVSAGRVSPPLKKAFERKGCPPVEIYPKAAWKRLIVADEDEILSRSSLAGVEGIGAYLPAPEDDFYLTATHAVSHMRIIEAEVMNTVRLIDEHFSWNRVWELASDFGTVIQTYFFLKATALKDNLKVNRGLEIFDFKVKGLVDAWFDGKRNPACPIEVPRIFGRFLPALYHEPAILKKISGWDIPYDFLSNFL